MFVPIALDCPINGDWFEAYITQALVPELRHRDVVIMGHLSPQARCGAVRCARGLRRGRARLMLVPPNNPDFNPIEKAVSRLKAMLRKLAAAPSAASAT